MKRILILCLPLFIYIQHSFAMDSSIISSSEKNETLQEKNIINFNNNFAIKTNSTPQSLNCRPCKSGKPNLFQSAYNRLHQVWNEGTNELYLPSYAWHNRYLYSKERIKTYNENPWGGGLGKGFYDEEGDWHGLYAFAFLDSHKNLEPIVGYAFLKVLHFNENTNIGGGYAILATARPDINKGIPFPGALPWVSFSYRRTSLMVTYIPGAHDVGNVLFLIAKVIIS